MQPQLWEQDVPKAGATAVKVLSESTLLLGLETSDGNSNPALVACLSCKENEKKDRPSWVNVAGSSCTLYLAAGKLLASIQYCRIALNWLGLSQSILPQPSFLSSFFHTWDKQKEEIITCQFNLVPIKIKLIGSTTDFSYFYITVQIHKTMFSLLGIFWMFAFLGPEHYHKSVGLTDLSRKSEWTNNTDHSTCSEPMWKSYSPSQFEQFI